ncbi:MAG: NAD(P)/FAD-dependent oxidoreductase [Desulfurellaceae bacterium]|nr:NAD(P)/FAD-dependent oxidoreductase [Desulfurellaceae bacterium]
MPPYLTRRQFFSLAGSLPFVRPLTGRARANTQARAVVVGGGFGGATCAKYLRLADPSLEVTLVTPQPQFITCPFSNAALVGLRSLASLTYTYQRLREGYGVQIAHAQAQEIDPTTRRLTLSDDTTLTYDKLVLSPGVELRWDAIEGYDAEASTVFPHAWQAGSQTLLLRRQLEAVQDGGLVVVSAPETPYRCPPGPYERASLIAHYLRTHKPRSKVLLLDAKDSFTKDGLFLAAWERLYPGLLEWVPGAQGGRVTQVDTRTGIVHTEFDEYKPAVANIIAPQRAAAIARAGGLDAGTGWCPVYGGTFESRIHPNIHIIGDAAIASPMPKSAFSANTQAKVCAAAIVALLRGEPVAPPALMNTCYSLVAPDYGISISAVYAVENDTIQVVPGSSGTSPLDAPGTTRTLEAAYARSWYANITADTFG